MNTFSLVISTPDGTVFRGDAVKLSLRGSEGELAVMAGHIPFVTAVKKGRIRLELEEKDKTAHTEGGILNVSQNKVTLLSGNFTWVEE